ncbi:hypothetical protein [Sinisalibacter aestuarii]|uniref:hypothetical protein n=1 Tax=Sinisalibacter aestuarii TaxID=2949426 RepID=UPI002490DB8B|nr:hypothetical protein [Sinisalibacter aestuarii]
MRYTVAIGFIAALFGFSYFQCDPSQCSDNIAVAIGVAGIGLAIVTSLYFAFSSIRFDPATLFVPAVIYPIGIALFFGFGTSSVYFSNSATRSLLSYGTYPVDNYGLLRTSFLTYTGVTISLLFMVLSMRFRFSLDPKQASQGQHRPISQERTAVFFIISGAFLKYGLILPESWGIASYTLPGTLKTMSPLVDLGFAIAAFLSAKGSRNWTFIFWVFWPVHVAFSCLEFSKRTIMLAILLPGTGAFLAHHNWRRLLPWVLLSFLAFASLQDVNSAGRNTIIQRSGNIADAGFSERVGILLAIGKGDIVLTNVISAAKLEAQTWWLRLNYSGQQLQAMELRDNGVRGEWTTSLFQAIIPRFLWPDKPVSVSQGRAFNQLVTGNNDASSHVGMTVFADGYWQMGWPGTVLFSALMGLILGFVTRVSYFMVKERQLIYFPVVLLGIQMAALGPTGYFQRAFVGMLPIFIGYLVLARILGRSVLSVRQSSHRRTTVQPASGGPSS